MIKNKFWAITFLTVLLSFLSVSNSSAIFMDLGDEEIVEAINFGVREAQTDDYAFLSPWMISLPKNTGEALLNTEFVSLAYESKKASVSGFEMTEQDIDDTLSRTRGRLVFSATLYGRGRTFAKDNEAILIIQKKGGEEEITSTFWENGDAQRISGKKYEAECSYWFPAKEVSTDDTVILLITSALGDEWEFKFDLSSMK